MREQGYDGPVTLVGDEAAAPYERPSLSKAFLTGKAAEADFTFATLFRRTTQNNNFTG